MEDGLTMDRRDGWMDDRCIDEGWIGAWMDRQVGRYTNS
jgi:hypothetical protein